MTSSAKKRRPSQFAAVELPPDKTPGQLVQVLFETCGSKMIHFDELLVMEIMSFGGGRRFLRFHSDLDIEAITSELLKMGLGVINPQGEVRTPGKEAVQRLALSRLCSARPATTSPPLPYRGTRDKYWRRQFH
jgi:hypothetical protein